VKLQAASVATDAAVVVLALQAPLQGRKPGPRTALMQEVIQRDLEHHDTLQSLLESQRRLPERRKCPKKKLSPFELVVQRDHEQLPPH
jgi:hypothetical protein